MKLALASAVSYSAVVRQLALGSTGCDWSEVEYG